MNNRNFRKRKQRQDVAVFLTGCLGSIGCLALTIAVNIAALVALVWAVVLVLRHLHVIN